MSWTESQVADLTTYAGPDNHDYAGTALVSSTHRRRIYVLLVSKQNTLKRYSGVMTLRLWGSLRPIMFTVPPWREVGRSSNG